MEPVPVIDGHFQERIQRSKLNFINEESVSLKKHMMALLMKKPEVIGTDDCWQVLRMLNENFKTLSGTELYKLGQVLKYYVRAYPCWGELAVVKKNRNKSEKEKNIDAWFTEFTIYLILKMEKAWEISKSLKEDECGHLEQQQIQTDAIEFCNYTIELEGPSNLIYSAVFNVSKGDVVARQHMTTPFSREKYKSMCRFINLPYVSVKAKFVDLSFERKNVHNIDRFITMAPVNFKKYSKKVRVERINEDEEVTVYTLHLYTMYFRQFMEILRNEPLISEIRKVEFKLVIEEILKDMQEAFVSFTVPTNATVTFTIGDNIYLRNKQTAAREINYYEIITPEVALSIHSFDAKQDLNDKHRITFESLNFFEKNKEFFVEHINSSRIIFECLLCAKSYLSLFTIQSHFEQEHREEHAVMCASCKKVICVASLVGNRWHHRCRGSLEV